MIVEILQVLIAVILLIGLIFILLHFVKYRKTNAEMLADLFNKCCREEKDNICRKRKF
jgi:hypothetical protein